MISYATDEDVALRASGDFAALCPRDQALGSGADGYFLMSDPWTLRSASVDFSACGLAPGMVVRLSRPATAYGPSGELLAVVATAPGAVTLRRKGQAPGVGQPPSPAAGISGVEFSALTLAPQIARASYDLEQRLGIDGRVAGRRPVDLLDPCQLRDAVVLTVLYRQYLDQARTFAAGSAAPDDWYAAKARIAKDELDEVLDRLALRWAGPEAAGPSATATRFCTRISR